MAHSPLNGQTRHTQGKLPALVEPEIKTLDDYYGFWATSEYNTIPNLIENAKTIVIPKAEKQSELIRALASGSSNKIVLITAIEKLIQGILAIRAVNSCDPFNPISAKAILIYLNAISIKERQIYELTAALTEAGLLSNNFRTVDHPHPISTPSSQKQINLTVNFKLLAVDNYAPNKRELLFAFLELLSTAGAKIEVRNAAT